MTARPPARLRHLALRVHDLSACESFYTDVMGMGLDLRPNDERVYLTSGSEHLALYRRHEDQRDHERLMWMSFVTEAPDDVEAWHAYLGEQGVKGLSEVRHHPHGSRSVRFRDPDGHDVQIMYIPTSQDD
ncbi:MAG TPA: VOC family protein [Acidimicrobiales bacterium]